MAMTEGARVGQDDVAVNSLAAEGGAEFSFGTLDRLEGGAGGVGRATGGGQVVVNGALRLGMSGELAELAAFAVDGEGGNAAALDKVLHAQRTEFGTVQSVGEDDTKSSRPLNRVAVTVFEKGFP